MTSRALIQGKIQSLRSLVQFAGYFRNWSEVWSAYRSKKTLPPLQLRKNNITIYHDDRDDAIALFREIFVEECYTFQGFYDPKPSDVVVDLGANVGFFTLFLASRAPGIRVHCFEPGRETRERLTRNVQANGLERTVTIHPYAISGCAGVVHFNTAKNAAQRSIFINEFINDGESEDVACISLDQVVEMTDVDRIDLLKMDIEGAEIEAVENADPKIWDRIDRVAFEFHDRFRPGCRERVCTVLAKHGFDRIVNLPIPHLEGMGMIHASR